MISPDQSENRRAHRIAVDIQAVVEPIGSPPIELPASVAAVYERVQPARDKLGQRYPVTIRDLSTNGAFIYGEPLPLMSRVTLRFQLLDFGDIDAIGWVLWRRGGECLITDNEGNDITLPRGFGVLFEAIPLDARMAIHSLVESIVE